MNLSVRIICIVVLMVSVLTVQTVGRSCAMSMMLGRPTPVDLQQLLMAECNMCSAQILNNNVALVTAVFKPCSSESIIYIKV